MSQVSVETTSTLGRKLTVRIPVENVRSQLDERLRKATRDIRLDGFSRKKPLKKAVQDQVKNLVEEKFGSQIRYELLQQLVDESLNSAITSEKLRMVGRPDIQGLENSIETLADADLTYTASFEVFPEVTLKPFKDFNVEKIVVTVQDEDVEKTLSQMRDQYADWSAIDRPAALGDRLKVDFTRSIEGEKPEVQKDAFVILGSKGMLPGLDDALIGKSVSSDVIELDLAYPETWADAEVAGDKLHLSIVIHEVAQKHLLEDAAFIERLGAGVSDLVGLKAQIRKSLESEVAQRVFVEAKETVLEELLNLHRGMDLPQSLIEQEIQGIHREAEKEQHDHVHGEHCNHDHGHDSASEHDCASHQEEAVDRVSLGLLINAVIQQKKLELDHAKVRAEIQKIAARFGGSPEIMKMYYQNENFLGQVQHQVLVDQAVAAILSEATIIDKPQSFDEVMQLA